MKYLSLLCLLFVAGCNLVPSVVDESIILPEPVVIDQADKVPAQPVPSPAPKAETAPAREVVELPPAPTKRVASVEKVMPIIRNPGHWTYPGTIENHLLTAHGVEASSHTKEQMLDIHDAIHEGTFGQKAKASTVQQFTIDSCGICKSDVRKMFPVWEKQGWTMLKPIDESANPHGSYPRYEIRGADGSFRVHVGSLQYYR
jgi:hypothetical protein